MTNESGCSDIAKLETSLVEDATRLLSHPIYPRLQTLENLRIFMSSHVFAVWDFMSLLKSLQARIAGAQIPWVPNKDSRSVRFINEIVLAEESDEIAPGVFLSHYELYLRAMDEIGADAEPIRNFVRAVSEGMPVEQTLRRLDLPPGTGDFVASSLEMARAPLHITAASFFYGREDILPEIFSRIVAEIENLVGARCEAFRTYLRRHIEVDKGTHGPMSKNLLSNLCGQDEAKWKDALHAARASIHFRTRLWDGLLDRMKAIPKGGAEISFRKN